jgi:MFS transporter, ACS family, hexuronate transporter
MLWLVHVINYLNISGIGILAPFIQVEFKLSSSQIGLLISALSIGSCLTQMPAGLVTDFFGVRRLLGLGVALVGVCVILFSQTPSYGIALFLLFAYGLCSAVVGPTTSRSVIDWFPAIGRATAMGVKQTGVNAGGILAGLLLPLLVAYFSWRGSLLWVGIAEVACAGLVYQLTRDAQAKTQRPRAHFAWNKMWSVFLDRNMMLLGGVAFCFMVNQFCFTAYFTLFLTRELHYSIVQAGQYFALAYVMGAAGRILWSLGSDYLLGGQRKGVLIFITVLMFFSSLALVLISFYPFLASSLLLWAVLVFGASGIGWNAIYLTMVGEVMGEESGGLTTGAGYFLGFIGTLLFPPAFGYVVDQTALYGYAWLLLVFSAAATFFLLYAFRERNAVVLAEEVI